MLYDTILEVFVLLVAIFIFAGIAIRVRVSYPILLVIGGGLLSFIPGLPTIKLDPQLVLLLFLPPLIYSSAWRTSWREFRANLRTILLLAIGLVLVTMLVVAVVAYFAIPSVSWPVAFVLGALLSPTDALAATTATKSMGISHNLRAIIEGESLVNDATALVAYSFAVDAVVNGTFSFWQAGGEFIIVSVGGIALGLVVAWPISLLHRYLDDTSSQITLTLLTPFAAYLLAEDIGVSGVLAAMAAGLYLGRKSALFFSSNTRLQSTSFWNVLVFLFNGFVFLLVGLQLRSVLADLEAGRSVPSLIWYGILVSVTVIAVRIAWVFAATYLLHVLARLSWIKNHRYQSWRNTLVLGWAGMRGGVSLAAALAVPTTIMGSRPFPERDLLIFLTFCVILATLVVQGLTMSPLIRLLGLQVDTTIEKETKEATVAAAQAALARLDELEQEDWVPADFARRMRTLYTRKIEHSTTHANLLESGEDKLQEHLTPFLRLREELLQAERATIIQLRNEGTISDEVLRRLERELDLEEEKESMMH
jgi:Na+/H+ antiporter